MKNKKIYPALLLIAVFSIPSCASKGGSKEYSMWLYNGVSSEYYQSYNSNPVLQYLLNKDDSGISFDFWVPAAGTQQNNYDTIVGSGDYPTLLQNAVSDPAPVMFKNKIIMDITDLVKENMPNYYQLIQNTPTLKNKTTFNVDGKERILSLTTLNESTPYYFSGMVYRRDWIVKYGENPTTKAKFTGGYTNENDKDSWVDDVVFPSGGTDPLYISDWEWMFDIFTKAQASLGITDSYCISEYYEGYTWGTGGLNSSFGESNPVWYQSTEEGRPVKFGGVSNSMRAYLQCLNSWYKNGWLDKEFNQRTRDMFYAIDTTNVRLGKVGMWQGLESDLGGRLDLHNGGYTDGIYVAGCNWPINDVYGASDTKNHIPNGVTVDSRIGSGFFVMNGANKKDLATLLKFIDYLYTEEGAVLRTLGLNKEQLSTIDSSFYDKYQLSEGTYTIGEDGRYVLADALRKDSGGLSVATSLDKFPGYHLVSSIDKGYAQTYEYSLTKWSEYGDQIKIWGSDAYANMSVQDQSEAQKSLNKVLDYMTRNVYKYINGSLDPTSDKQWTSWCDALKKFNYDNISTILQKYVDMYPIG